MSAQHISTGFLNPVHDSQQWYRTVLEAMSRPGMLCTATNAEHIPSTPATLNPTTAALALTLLDHEVNVWVQQPEDELVQWIQFHCGCVIQQAPPLADFTIIQDGSALPDLAQFSIGTAEYPDRSTTLIIQVESLKRGESVSLSGPGILSEVSLQVEGLDKLFWQTQKNNTTLFPQGFDTILAAPEGVVCIPRSISIRRHEGCM